MMFSRMLKLVGHVSYFWLIYLFTLGSEMGSLGINALLCCQGLACVGTMFPNKIWNRLSVLKVFPKYIYVKTVDGLITIFTVSKICCVLTRLAMSYCCCFTLVALSYNINFFENYHVFLSSGPAVGMADM